MKKIKFLLSAASLSLLVLSANAQDSTQVAKSNSTIKNSKTDVTDRPFGKGIINYTAKDGSWSTKMTMRFQTLYTYGHNVSENLGITGSYSNFMIRRARLKFTGHAYSPKLKYKLELGQSSRDVGGFTTKSENKNAPGLVFDAVVKWNFAKGLYFWAGQTKLPGNRERVISSGSLQLVDRSLLNSNFNVDRDMGIQLHHKWKIGNMVIKEKVALSQGEGRDIVINNLGGYSYTPRVEILPFGEFDSKGKDDYSGSSLKRTKKYKLALAGGFDWNDRAARTGGHGGSFLVNDSKLGYHTSNITTIFIDMIMKYKGWSLMAEYANRTAENAIAKNIDGSKTGKVVMEGLSYNVMGGYLFSRNWEITGRYTTVDYANQYTLETGKTDVTQYTVGLSKYLAGHKLKVQADVSLKQTLNKDDGYLGRIHMELQF